MRLRCVLLPCLVFIALGLGCNSKSGSGTEPKQPSSGTTPQPSKDKAAYAYSILKEEVNAVVTNYHVWIKDKDFTKEGLTEFAKNFRKENCSTQCNISLYDTDEIANDVSNFDLEGKDYLFFADHFIGASSFEMPDEPILWYPYQDFKYRDLGGRNWKKEPIK